MKHRKLVDHVNIKFERRLRYFKHEIKSQWSRSPPGLGEKKVGNFSLFFTLKVEKTEKKFKKHKTSYFDPFSPF